MFFQFVRYKLCLVQAGNNRYNEWRYRDDESSMSEIKKSLQARRKVSWVLPAACERGSTKGESGMC